MARSEVLSLHGGDAVLDVPHWLARCRAGDQVAIAQLVARYRSRLIRTSRNILRDSHEAEDVAQESFLKAFRELSKLRDDRAFASYLYRICVRLCMDRLRARRAEPVEIETSEAHQGGQVENRLLIEKLLAMLPADLQTTLVLREIEQFSYEEIADYMHVPVGTVRSRLHTARERFRRLWVEATAEGS